MRPCPFCSQSLASDAYYCKHCRRNVPGPGESLEAFQRAVTGAAAGEAALTATMTPDQRRLFDAEMATRRKSRGTAQVLALLLGGLGGHHFYLGNAAAGVLYVVFSWTFIPVMISVIEIFLVGARVDRYNLAQAQLVAARIALSSRAA